MHQLLDDFGKSLMMRDATLAGSGIALSLPLCAAALAGNSSGALDRLLNSELIDCLSAFHGKTLDHSYQLDRF